jgi:hypothetical protein
MVFYNEKRDDLELLDRPAGAFDRPADEKEEHLQRASCKEYGLILSILLLNAASVYLGFKYLGPLYEFYDLLHV